MKIRFYSLALMAMMIFSAMSFVSCDDDDDDNDGSSVISFENVTEMKDFVQSGKFPAIAPGQSIEIIFNAGKGQAIMFATMYGNSNDLFFAPDNPGISLYNGEGTPITGDLSPLAKLWDNGTRINQAPGSNVSHPGTADNGNITMINGTDAQGHSYLPASELMKLNLTYNKSRSEFTLTITNNSNGTSNETPMSPGVWVVSNILDGDLLNEQPYFTAGQKSGSQLTTLAETGNNNPLYDMVNGMTGIITKLSPTLVVIYTGDVNPIYELNKKDGGLGLQALAQKGETDQLEESLKTMSNVRNVYIAGGATTKPGQKNETHFDALRGDKIAYATMFG